MLTQNNVRLKSRYVSQGWHGNGQGAVGGSHWTEICGMRCCCPTTDDWCPNQLHTVKDHPLTATTTLMYFLAMRSDTVDGSQGRALMSWLTARTLCHQKPTLTTVGRKHPTSLLSESQRRMRSCLNGLSGHSFRGCLGNFVQLSAHLGRRQHPSHSRARSRKLISVNTGHDSEAVRGIVDNSRVSVQ